jgi:hypothetical protein
LAESSFKGGSVFSSGNPMSRPQPGTYRGRLYKGRKIWTIELPKVKAQTYGASRKEAFDSLKEYVNQCGFGMRVVEDEGGDEFLAELI